jgi:hypothetical protein
MVYDVLNVLQVDDFRTKIRYDFIPLPPPREFFQAFNDKCILAFSFWAFSAPDVFYFGILVACDQRMHPLQLSLSVKVIQI